MDEDLIDQGREATAVQGAFIGNAESLLNELSGAFDEPTPPEPPQPFVEEAALTPEEIPVTSPPRVEPPVMIWKPSRRARFKLRLR
ncbi:MAG TPA: hypothetical protein VKV69_10625 [Actinomycetota bacterium]|nr:hypothetical protein [Actinomycetota bacterium]